MASGETKSNAGMVLAHTEQEVTAAAAEFVALWTRVANGDLDKEQASAQLMSILARTELSCRVVHGMPNSPAFDGEANEQKLAASLYPKRLAWVFGPDVFPMLLTHTPRDFLLHCAGFTDTWLEVELKRGRRFKLVVFPSASVDSKPATWGGVAHFIESAYNEVWPKVSAHLPEIEEMTLRAIDSGKNPIEAIERICQYDMEAVHLVGRLPPYTTGESKDPRYISLQRLQLRKGTLVEIRQFLLDEIGLSSLFTGNGNTISKGGIVGPQEFLALNLPLRDIEGCAILANFNPSL